MTAQRQVNLIETRSSLVLRVAKALPFRSKPKKLGNL